MPVAESEAAHMINENVEALGEAQAAAAIATITETGSGLQYWPKLDLSGRVLVSSSGDDSIVVADMLATSHSLRRTGSSGAGEPRD
jgi:hypothetical protein